MICFGILVMVCELTAAPAPPPASTYCQIAKPMYWSTADTRQTKEQIDTENRKWKKLCSKPTKQ
jgi:hypothetical protein